MNTMEAARDADDSEDGAERERHSQLCAAIVRRSMVMFEYGDLLRVVEPHRYGVNAAGHATLSGWLRAGYSRSDPAGGWRSYRVSDMRSLQVLDAPFAGTRPGYAAHDARMREVFAELMPTAMEIPVDAPAVVREPSSWRATPAALPRAAAEPPRAGDAASLRRIRPADRS